MERNGLYSDVLWPEDIKRVCGCVGDSLRHSITWEEAIIVDNNSQAHMSLIVAATLPICVDEIKRNPQKE